MLPLNCFTSYGSFEEMAMGETHIIHELLSLMSSPSVTYHLSAEAEHWKQMKVTLSMENYPLQLIFLMFGPVWGFYSLQGIISQANLSCSQGLFPHPQPVFSLSKLPAVISAFVHALAWHVPVKCCSNKIFSLACSKQFQQHCIGWQTIPILQSHVCAAHTRTIWETVKLSCKSNFFLSVMETWIAQQFSFQHGGFCMENVD